MQSKDGKHSNSDDAALFRDAVGDVRRLDNKKKAKKRHQPKPARPTAKAVQRRRDEQKALIETLEKAPPENADVETGEELSYKRASVDPRVFKKMRSGKISVREEVDLHALTRTEAKTYLHEFIQLSHAKGLRCVRVVHGKGLGSGPAGPVIKHGVNNWLRSWDEVLAFCTAPAHDGGTGAVYVLLKAR